MSGATSYVLAAEAFSQQLRDAAAQYDSGTMRLDTLALLLCNVGQSLSELAAKAECDLIRLAGPVCPHDGKRAIEHDLCVCFGHVMPDSHPRWPDGVTWLREHSK